MMDQSLLLQLGQRLHALTVSSQNYLNKPAFSKQCRNKMTANSQATTVFKSIPTKIWNSCICWEPGTLTYNNNQLLSKIVAYAICAAETSVVFIVSCWWHGVATHARTTWKACLVRARCDILYRCESKIVSQAFYEIHMQAASKFNCRWLVWQWKNLFWDTTMEANKHTGHLKKHYCASYWIVDNCKWPVTKPWKNAPASPLAENLRSSICFGAVSAYSTGKSVIYEEEARRYTRASWADLIIPF